MASVSGTMDPIEFYRERKGICSDYAVFTVSALLSAGAEDAYILIFNTTKGLHATAAFTYQGRLYIVDQSPPVLSWDEYTKKVFEPVGDQMVLIRVSLDKNGYTLIVELWSLKPSEFMELVGAHNLPPPNPNK